MRNRLRSIFFPRPDHLPPPVREAQNVIASLEHAGRLTSEAHARQIIDDHVASSPSDGRHRASMEAWARAQEEGRP
jgi:hypothetical protein